MSEEIYGFRSAPTYRGATRDETIRAALEMPMSRTSTFFDQAKGGILESFGLGTAFRDISIPEGNVEEPDDGYSIRDAMELLSPHPLVRTYELAKRGVQHFVNDPESPALSEDAYKSSAWFREGVAWDQAMTEQRAAALAESFDARKVREFYASKRPITAFIGNLAGQAADPINYIPVAGPAVRAAAVARLGKVGGASVAASLDAAANTAIFGVATSGVRGRLGDDVSWQTTVSQIATAALIGAGFGAVAGGLSRRVDAVSHSAIEERLSTLKTTQEARIALNEGIDALVHGEDVRLSPNATEPVRRIGGEIPAVAAKSEFTTEVRGASHGQMDMTLRMKVGGEEVGRIDFAEFEGRPAIQMIDVAEAQRRKGFATAMLQELQAKYPDQEIDWGSLTADGAKLRASTVFKEVPTEDAPKFAELDLARETAKAIEAERTAKWEPGKPLDRQSPEVQELATREIDATDTVSSLEYQLRSASPTKQLIAMPERQPSRTTVDTTPARADAPPEGIKDAEKAIAKPDDYKALAAQYRVDPETGTFSEEADIAQLAIEGRLLEEDVAALAEAQNVYDDGAAYGEALKSVAGCLV